MIVVILRGLPGAGKDHWLNKHLKKCCVVCSADEFRYSNGVYTYAPGDGAHEKCLKKYLEKLAYYDQLRHGNPQAATVDAIVVNNTNTMAWEIAPYYAAALAYRLPCSIVRTECDPVVACRRNVHNVPAATIFAMYRNLLTERLPGHWKEEIILPEAANVSSVS